MSYFDWTFFGLFTVILLYG